MAPWLDRDPHLGATPPHKFEWYIGCFYRCRGITVPNTVKCIMTPSQRLLCTLSLALLPTFPVLLCCRTYAQNAATSGSGTPTQFAYKGMYLGMTVREFSNNYRLRLFKEGWRFKNDESAPSELNCADIWESCTLKSPEVYGLKAEPSFTSGGKMYFLKLSGFSSDHTAEFVTAFTKKYGVPRLGAEKYQNAFGAVYSGREWMWVRGKGSPSLLSIQEICRELDTPCISLMDYKLYRQVEKEDSQTLSVE